jgi:hypothetical protein
MSKINQIIVNPNPPQTPKSSKETLNSLKKELEVLGGKVFLGFVHPTLYGPVRNLNFILEGPNPEFLDKYLTDPQKDIVIDVWKETMMATQLMVLPWEMSLTCEINPPTFKTIKESEIYIRKKLADNKQKNINDPFFYRKGTI